MKQSKKMRLLSMVLAVMLIFSTMPVAVLGEVDYDESLDNYYNVISKDDYELAPGIVESEIVLNNAAGTHRQVAHVVEVDLNNEYAKVIPSYKGMIPTAGNYGVQIMSEQAAYAEANGYGNVVAAMNLSLSWYDSAYYQNHPELVGEPLGYMVLDGKMYTNSQGKTSGAQTCVVINFDEKDGEVRPTDMPKVEIRSTSSAITGWEEQVIPANFGFLVKNGVNQYKTDNNAANGASRSFVGVKEDGTFVMVMNDGRQAPYSSGFTNYEMAEFMLSLGCVQAVNGDGGGSSAFLSQRPGEELKLNCSPSDGAERPTTHGILVISTAPATGEFVRASISADNDYYTPGSTVEFNAIGTDLVGTAAEIPADVTWQLADETMGTIEDGVFVSNGTEGTVTAQMVYNGHVVGEASVEIVVPTEFSFAQEVMTVPFDKEVTIGLVATINGGLHNVVLKPEDVEFSTDNDELGVFDGFQFTSVSEEDAPGNLKSTLTATLVYDTALVATAELNLGKGSEILFDFEDEADIDDWNIADVNGNDNGFYQHLSYATEADGQVHDGEGSMRVEMNPISAPGISSGGYAQSDLYLNEGVVVENAKSIGFWAYIPDEYEHCWIRVLYWYDPDGDGKFDKKNTISVISQPEVYNTWDESAWKYFSVDVSKYSKVLIPGLDCEDRIAYNASKNDANNFRFIEFMFPHTNTNDIWKTYGTINGLQTVYVDNITADFSDAVDDREAPVFKSVTLADNDEGIVLEKYNTETTTDNLITVTAVVAEDTTKTNATGLDESSAKAYIDGVEVDVTFANGRMTISDVLVADGIHRIKFEICDNMGNKAVVIRLIEVDAGVEASTIEVVPADASLDKLYGGSVYWMNLNANKIETIESVETVIDLNYGNHWELDNMVLAEGFEAEYTIDEENNTATILLTRTDASAQTGAVTLAALPIRVISYDDIDVVGYTAETYWNDYDFWPYDLKVDVDMGDITYVDGYTSNVLGVFSNEEFSVKTEMYTSSGNMDAAFKAERGTAHVHTAESIEDKVATCTESGYTDRTYCEVCSSVVEWGNVEDATGHNYVVKDGVLMCEYCDELYNGELDGKTYVDGVIADGWVDETYYYIDGVKVTGQYYMDGVLYTFDEDGKYDADYSYTGFYTTEEDKLMYFMGNKYLTGYQYLAGEPYYFDSNGYGYEGEYVLCGEICYFEAGQYVSCSTANLLDAGKAGAKAEYVIYNDGTFVLGGSGETYSFTNHGTRPFIGYTYKIKTLKVGSDITRIGTYFFAYSSVSNVVFEEGSSLKQIGSTAFYQDYALKTIELPESVEYISNMAFGKCENLSKVVMPENIATISKNAFKNWTNLTLHVADGSYAMDYAIEKGIPYVVYAVDPDEADGEIVDVEGVLYYYENGAPVYAGLIKLDGDYYYVRSSGKVAVDCVYWVTKTNDLLDAGNYKFDSEGKMIDPPAIEEEEQKGEIVDVEGVLYYYENGAPVYAGLIELGGEYYYVRSSGKIVVDATYWVTKTNGLKDAGNYKFDSEGKMVIEPTVEPDAPDVEDNGKIVEENGVLYYYENGLRVYAGLIKLNGNYYYVRSNGQLAVDCVYWVTKTNDWLAVGNYTFGSDGKMVNAPTTDEEEKKGEIVEENGVLYYYENGVLTYAGLIELDGDYYYVRSSGKLAVDCVYWVTKTNGLKDAGNYTFGSDGKMIAE